MQNHEKTPEDIEREIENERAQLRSTVGDLQERFSVDQVIRQVSDQLRDNGGEIGRSVGRAVRENPMAVALTGVGLAWMIFGDKRDTRYPHPVAPRGADSRPQNRSRLHDASHYSSHSAAGDADHDANHPSWVRPDWANDPSRLDDDHEGIASKVSDAASGTADSVARAGSNVKQSVAGAASSVADKVSGAIGAGRDSASHSAQAVKERSAAMRKRLAEGTEHLSEEARARVIAAREKAVMASERAREMMHKSSDRASDFYEEHPLVAGALALAVGAAIAGALPRTRTEDQYFGQHSDELFHEAERIFQEERAKAEKVLNATVKEAQKVASEVKRDLDNGAPGDQSAVDAIKEKAADVSDRIARKASETARNEDLGKPKINS